MELYSASMERQVRLMKTMAAALGADVPDDDSSSSTNDGYNINTSNDLGFLPINLGYEIME